MLFQIHARKNGQEKIFSYDNINSILKDENNNVIVDDSHKDSILAWSEYPQTSKETPNNKTNYINSLKIQLGLSCNYSCEYCSQRFVPHNSEGDGTPRDVQVFLNNLDTWLYSAPKRIEYWGGEPFVYWKTLKPLVEALRQRFPSDQTSMLITTNGSLLTYEINEWLDKMDIEVGISHDGPGQWVRGPDPFDDPEQKKIILDCYKRLIGKKYGGISFNSMVNRHNNDRAKIQQWFENLLGEENLYNIGEGSFIDPYDEGGASNSLQSIQESVEFRNRSIEQLLNNKVTKFDLLNHRIQEWIYSISVHRPASTLGQKCGMDSPETVAVDLKGNVLTCQNVSNISVAPNGLSHKIGHVSSMDKVRLRTATHWNKRKECIDCPVLQLCKGSCMFLEDTKDQKLWTLACNNAYNDHIPFLAAAIEKMTGYLPHRIESENLPENRKSIWNINNIGETNEEN